MSKPIGPGSLLVCTKVPQDEFLPRGVTLTVGAIYTCQEVLRSRVACPSDGCGHDGIALRERPRGLYWIGDGGFFERLHRITPMFCPNVFRPLDDGDTSLVADEVVEDAISPGELVPAL